MADRIEVMKLTEKEEITVTASLETIDLASSTHYKSKKSKKEDGRKNNKGRPKTSTSKKANGEIVSDSEVISAIRELRNQEEFGNAGGYHKLKHYLSRFYGFVINKKKIYRLCKENGLLLSKKKKSTRKKSPIAINRTVTRPFQLWELDIKYCYIPGEERFFYLMPIIDVYTRFIMSYYIGLSCTGKDLALTLKTALEEYGIKDRHKLTIRSDNGPQMTSKRFLKQINLDSSLVNHELIPVNTPNKNAHIESFNSIFEVEFLQMQAFVDYPNAYEKTVKFIKFYQEKRIHGSLGFLTPQEVMEKHSRGEELKIKPIKL